MAFWTSIVAGSAGVGVLAAGIVCFFHLIDGRGRARGPLPVAPGLESEIGPMTLVKLSARPCLNRPLVLEGHGIGYRVR